MKHLSAINHFFWKYKWRLFLGILFIILTNYFRILTPQITGYVINTVVHKGTHTQLPSKAVLEQNDILVQHMIIYFQSLSFGSKIIASGIVLLVLALISGFFMFLMRQTIIVMSRLIEFDQKNLVFSHYQQLDMSFYKANSTGDLMNRISEDVGRVRMYTGPALMYFINLAAVLSFSIFFMLKASPKLTMYALVPLPLLAIAIYTVNTIIHKKSEKVQGLLSNLTANVQESFSGIRVIKSFVQEKSMFGFFAKNSDDYRKNALDLAKTEAIYGPSMMLLIGISTLLTVMVGALDVVHDPVHNKVGTIAEFVMYIQMMTFPVSAIGWTASMIQRAAASQKRINEFMDTVPAIKDDSESKPVQLKGDIDFKDVSFTYDNTGITAVKNFSLHVTSGERVAVVGRTGSGKTTLFNLLLRMYDVGSGSILYDDVDLRKIKLNSIRSQIAYVPQDSFLFSDSIANNIAFGDVEGNRQEVYKAAKAANIYDEIMQFEKGFETIVGERGVTLSGGQKQRVSIARAFMKDAQILLLDDCLSAVDAKTERLISDNINDFQRNKTIFIISHRIFSSIAFDKIVVLDEGRIAELGTHDELLALKGIYFEMYQQQLQSNNDI